VRRPVVAVAAAVSFVACAAAADAQVRFRTETTVVYLDVVVRDAAGRPVTGLEAGDFEVLEDGVVQPLVWFDRSNAGNAAAARSIDAARRVSPAFASNADFSQGPPQSIFAIVFHQLTTEPRYRATQAAHALVDRLAPGDYCGIYVFDKELTELAPFTHDRGALHRAIATASITPPDFRNESYRRGSAEDPGQQLVPGRIGSSRYWMDGMRPSEAVTEGTSFRGLVEVLDAYVGRRAIVLFSEGLAWPEVLPRLELLADAAAPAHVSFYTIDAAGLRVTGPVDPAPGRPTKAELSSVSSPARLEPARILEMDRSRGLRPIAELTGGLYVAGTNDLKAALARVDADRRSYYVMAYRASSDGPARPRAIEVRVKRPKVMVRARTALGSGSLGVGTPRESTSQDP
jgi:VWFA-related protein